MNHAEDRLQAECVQLLRVGYPGVLFWHTPNGGHRSRREGARMKVLGVLPGVADLIILGDDGKPLFVELKTETGRQSGAQRLFQARVEERGCGYWLIRSVAEFLDLLGMLEKYGKIH